MGVGMGSDSEATGNGQDHDQSRVQELIRAWTDTRLAFHATTDSEEKRLLAERSELIAGEIPAEPGIQDFMEIFEQSLAPKSLYRYRFYTSDDLKGLSDGAQASLYAAEWKAIRRFGFPDDADYYSGFSKLLGWPALVQWRDLDRFEDFEDALLLLQVDDYCNGEDTQHWGPGGSLYYFIPQQALREQNFAACEFEIQFT
jgi:Domain of unknown function (DUF1963)